jgi:hypothetical protein
MTPEKPDQPAPWKGLLGAIALSWLPVVLFLSLAANKATEPKAFGFAAAGAMLVVVVYVTSRKHAWSAILWVPLMLFAGIGGPSLLGTGFSTPTSGPSAGPLEGVAVLIMLLLAAGFGLMATTGILVRPKTWNSTMLVTAGLNSALMFVVGSSGYHEVTRQDIIVHLSDPSGRPISGTSVEFEIYALNQSQTSSLVSRGIRYSDNDGVARIPTRDVGLETRMKIFKGGCRQIELEIKAETSKQSKTRDFVLSTYETPAIHSGTLPSTEPFLVALALPSDLDAPSSKVRHVSLYSKHDLSQTVRPKSLDLETGKFAADLSGDLELEYFSAKRTRFRDQQLRIRGLNGVELFLASHNECLPTAHTLYEQLYRVAPQSGYRQEVIISNPGNSPGPVVYIRASDGKLHGRLCLEALGDGVDETPRYNGTLEINPSGRNLEWVKKND